MSENVDTICVQGGYQPGNGESRTPPIIQATTFKYQSSEQMSRLFDLSESGYFYTRLQNPTNDTVAAKICELEGGAAAMLTSSGQAANFFALFNICNNGDHIVASSAIYGGTFNLINVTMRKMGVECTFVSPDCTEEELEAAFQPNTKAVFGESISNPALIVLDFEKFANAAHRHGVPLIVDNTFPTPINCRPFQYGVDIVTHATTKYMDGHGSCVGGAIVDSGNFDWMAHAEKFPGLTTPDDSYHGVTYAKEFGKAAYITKATAQLMRDFGSTPAPINSWIMGMHLESLGVRMERHWRERTGRGQVARRRSARQLGELPGPRNGQVPCAGGEVHAERHLRCDLLRRAGRPREGLRVPRPSEDGVHRHACGRCAQLHAVSGRHHASPAHRGAA